MLMRDKQGRFQVKNGNTKYTMVQHKNKRMGKHKKNICIALGISNLPIEFVVHHLDSNIQNNLINNLAVMTVTAHNRLHSHTAWNKGFKKGVNKQWDDTIKKAQTKRFINFLPEFKKTFELQVAGKKLREIALIQGISRRQVSDRILRYKNYIKSIK